MYQYVPPSLWLSVKLSPHAKRFCAEGGACTTLSDLSSYEEIHCSFSEGESAPGLTFNPCQFITSAAHPSGYCWVVYCLRMDLWKRRWANDRCSIYISLLLVLHRAVRWAYLYLNKKIEDIHKEAIVCTFYGCMEVGQVRCCAEI